MAYLRLQEVAVSGVVPTFPTIRLTGVLLVGQAAIASDIYAYTGTDWKPTPMLSWDGEEWR